MTLAADVRAYNIALTIGVATDELHKVLPAEKRGPIFELLSAAQDSAAQLCGDLASVSAAAAAEKRKLTVRTEQADNVVQLPPRNVSRLATIEGVS